MASVLARIPPCVVIVLTLLCLRRITASVLSPNPPGGGLSYCVTFAASVYGKTHRTLSTMHGLDPSIPVASRGLPAVRGRPRLC